MPALYPNKDLNKSQNIEYLRDGLSYTYLTVKELYDKYDIDGKIYFGEMTFYHAGGMSAIKPYEMDVKFGENFIMKKYNEE